MEVRAKVVIASSGGYQANIEWLKQGWGEAAENFLIRGTPYAKGAVLKSLLGQGVASVGDPAQCHAVAIDGRSPKFDGGIATRLDCVPFSVVVNKHGQRFYDEGQDVWPKRYAIWGRLVAQQPDQLAYSIIDSRSERLFMPSIFPAIKADTVGALAIKLGLDPDALEATVSQFNAACQPGTFDNSRLDGLHTAGLDVDKTNWARPIAEPPFIGYPLRPGITFTYLGVKVNDRAQVIMEDGRPAANLFASGEIMAGSILGKGYLAGFGMAIGTAFGRIAGREAAKICPELTCWRWRAVSQTDAMLEARRAMEVCNACRYCEGFCAVFPAMELRREFGTGDLNYLANLCHSCRGCYYACQYAPPHEFGINVPRALAEVRAESYAQYAWPDPLARLYRRNGLVMAMAMAIGVGGLLLLSVLLQSHAVLFAPQSQVPGQGFYNVIPYGVMVGVGLRHLRVLPTGAGDRLRPVLARHRRHDGGAEASAAADAGVPRRGDAEIPGWRRWRLQRP